VTELNQPPITPNKSWLALPPAGVLSWEQAPGNRLSSNGYAGFAFKSADGFTWRRKDTPRSFAPPSNQEPSPLLQNDKA
jgi:hypothetical protein